MPDIAKPGPEARTQALSDENLARMDKDPRAVSTLSTADKYALASRLMAGDEPTEPSSPEPAPAPAPAEDAPAAPAAPVEEKAPEEPKPQEEAKEPVRKDRRYWKEKSIQEANERNQLKQQLESTQRRLKAFEESEAQAKLARADKPLDPYDDKEMKSTADKIAQMEKELSSYREHFKTSVKDEADRIQQNLAKQEETSVFTEISRLQSEFDDLRTDKPFEKLNAEYANWLDRLVEISGFKERNPTLKMPELRSMAREFYDEDEDFRRDAVAKKAKPPKELEKIETILTIHEKKSREGGNYRGAYLDHLADSGTLPNVIARRERDAALKASQATVDAMTRGQKGAETLTPTDGTHTFPETSGPEKMQAFLTDLSAKVSRGHRMSAAEKATAMQYMDLLATGL